MKAGTIRNGLKLQSDGTWIPAAPAACKPCEAAANAAKAVKPAKVAKPGKKTIASMLEAVQGARKVRLVTPDEVRAVAKLAAKDGAAFITGGTVANAYDYKAVTTVVLAVKVPRKGVAIGVGHCDAHGKPTPGRAWKELQPWGRGDQTAKLATWSASSDRLIVRGGGKKKGK